MFLGAPDFARSEKKHSHRFSIFCVFTQPRSEADIQRSPDDVRFAPESGHPLTMFALPVLAKEVPKLKSTAQL